MIIIMQLQSNLRYLKEKSKVQQHKLVYEALEGKMGGVLHALSLTTIVDN